MQYSVAILALLAASASNVAAQVTALVTPTAAAPAGCSATAAGEFQITVVNSTILKRDEMERRADSCGTEGTLTLTLAGGILHDAKGRTGYIASNFQFQFDEPPQTGAIYTGGFSVCSNGSLALGGSAIFYECLSGSFYNLYNENWAAQCEPVLIDILACSASSGAASVASDGQPTVTGAATITQLSDGQPGGTGIATLVSQITDGQPQAPSAGVISEYSDGQPQVPVPTAVGQISDGQVQVTTAAVATSAPAVVSQISDGQVQATSAAAQAPGSPAVVSQISDGQIQATSATAKASSTPEAFTGAAATAGAKNVMALGGAVLAFAML